MTGASAAGARRPAFRRIDWHRAAQLLAAGHTIARTAREVGCSRSQLSRRRNNDTVFRCWIENCRKPLSELRDLLQAKIEDEVRRGNVRVILWLADRLKLVTAPDPRTPDHELRALIGSLTPDELREFEELGNPGMSSAPMQTKDAF